MKVSFRVISMAALLCALPVSPVLADDNAEMFKKLDVNGDGFISATEALAHPDLPGAFEDGDDNADGRLDMAEFAVLEILED